MIDICTLGDIGAHSIGHGLGFEHPFVHQAADFVRAVAGLAELRGRCAGAARARRRRGQRRPRQHPRPGLRRRWKVYADAATTSATDLVVQSVTMSEISAEALRGLRAAVVAGTGLAGWHGGIADSYRASSDYLQLVGGRGSRSRREGGQRSGHGAGREIATELIVRRSTASAGEHEQPRRPHYRIPDDSASP